MSETLTTIEKALLLKDLEFFRNVSVEQLAVVAALAEEVRFAAGDVILRPDDPSEYVYVLLEGSAVVERDGIITTVVQAGRGIGDLRFEPGATYGMGLRAVQDVFALRLAEADFADAVLDQAEIALGVIRALAMRLREVGQQMAALSREVQERPPHAGDPP